MNLKICILYCLIGFYCYSQELKTYESIYNHWNIEGFLNQFNRSIDTDGVVIQKGEYRALIISFYGIINYHEFQKTNDSLYYYRVINQYKYFKDTSKLKYFDEGLSVGLPYLTPFNGLKAPWFSGMTQGTAVSYLLRYYKMTGDHSALELSKKIVHFMIKDESDGGTIGVTKEGYKWIEEYPNCKSSKSVLNGFINGLIGLKEYLDFFPEDTNVRKIHDECYDAMFLTLSEYDQPNWTSYNRNNKGVTNGYMRYQLSEFDHLFNIYHDERFKLQMMIWSKLAVSKLCKELKFYKNPTFEYAKNINEIEPNNFRFDDKNRFLEGLTNEVERFNEYFGKKYKTLNLNFDKLIHYCEIEYNEELKEPLIIEGFQKKQKQVIKYELIDGKLIIQSENAIDSIIVKFSKKIKKSNTLTEVNIHDKYNYLLPFYGVVNIKEKFTLTKGNKYRIAYLGNNLSDGRVFYRYAISQPELQKQKYQIKNSFNLKDVCFIAPESGVFECFISYLITNPESGISDFELIEE